MKRASQKDKLFHCLYHPLEPGVYTINVQWSGKHVQGSPYKVLVAATEMDLLADRWVPRVCGKVLPLNTL